jgi:hypothetical protein
MYLWHVHVGSCSVPGAPVLGWTYRTQDAEGDGTLTSDAAGNANTKAKSATFNADRALSYSVDVQLATPTNGVPAGTLIACGDLTANKAGGAKKPPVPTSRAARARPRHTPRAPSRTRIVNAGRP